MNASIIESNVVLIIDRIRGIAFRTDGFHNRYNDTGILPSVRAHVSFSGSIPKMKVSSFDMCPHSGILAIESSTPEVVDISQKDENKVELDKKRFFEFSFTDTFQENRQNQIQSSGSSLHISRSLSRPHLRFDLRGDGRSDVGDEQASFNHSITDSQRHEILKFHIVFRLAGVGVIAEGVANIKFPKEGFGGLPLYLEVPLIQILGKKTDRIAKDDAMQKLQIFFDDSACVCVLLNNSTSEQNVSSSQTEFDVFRHVQATQRQKIINEKHADEEEIQKRQNNARKSSLYELGHENSNQRRFGGFGCGGGIEIKNSIRKFLDGLPIYSTKCTDQKERELFANSTMTSTILTRESLEI